MSIIEFPILTVTGTTGAAGADGSDGTTVVYDSTTASPTATTTTSWETLMTKTGVTNLTSTGDKLDITTIFNTNAPTTTAKYARIEIDSVVVGDGSSYYYQFSKGTYQCKMNIVITRLSATSLHLDITWGSYSTINTSSKSFTEVIAVADTASLDFEAAGDSASIGDITCEQLMIKYLKKV